LDISPNFFNLKDNGDRKMSKKLFSVLSLLIAASMILAACAPAPAPEATTEPEAPAVAETPAPEAPAEPAGPSGEVTLWHAYQTGSAEETTLGVLIENAQAAYPDMTINVLQIPFSEIFNKYQTEVAAGGGPDMFVAPNDDLGNWARGGLVLALDSYLQGKLDKTSNVGVEGMKVDGKLYGVPESAKAVALYYNKSLIDTPPTSTEELLDMVKAGSGLVNVQGAYHLFGWSGAFGGVLLDGTNTCVADQGGWTEFMQYLVDLKAAGAVFEPDYGKAEGLFRQGKAAMFVNGPWALADYKKDLGDNLGVAPMPAGPVGPATPLNGIDGFYINPNSQNIQSAVDLALFLTNQESSQIYTDQAGHVPIRSDVTAADPLVAAFAEASATGYPRPQSAEFANYWTPFGDMFTKVLEGAISPAEGVSEACQAMNTANGKEVAVESPVSGEVTLWHAYQTGSAEETTLGTLVENAQARFPDLTINVLQIPFSEIFNKYQTEVAAGGGPDMFVAPNDDLGNWARGELVLALDQYLQGRLGKVSTVGVEGMKVDGLIYGVPESAKAVALYYNKSLVEKVPTTTDELMAMVTDGNLVNVQGAYHLFGWSGAFGGQLMDETGKCIADQGGWVDFMQYLVDLKAAGAIFEPDYGKAEGLFRQGNAAMFVNGPWALADYKKDLGDNLGVAPMPAGPAGPATPLNGIDGFYINPNSQNILSAVELALFLTNQESSQIYTDSAGHVPIRSDVTAADPLVAAFAEASATGFPRPQSEQFANYWTPFGDMFTKVLEGAVTPEEGVAEACQAMNTANGF
jgi:arabinogalactan oligomer/maltooligosaccharide transport system substrate-binding protein